MHTLIAKLFKKLDEFFFAVRNKCYNVKDKSVTKAIESKSASLVRIAQAKEEADKAHDEALEIATKELARGRDDMHRSLDNKRKAALDAITALEDL